MTEKEIAKVEVLIKELTLDVEKTVQLEKDLPDPIFQRVARQHGVFLTNNIERLKGLYNEFA